MNPPFGVCGAMAVKHVKKAYSHLRDGGRLVALLPNGLMNGKPFDKWYYFEIKGGYMVAEIELPNTLFYHEGA